MARNKKCIVREFQLNGEVAEYEFNTIKEAKDYCSKNKKLLHKIIRKE